MRLHAEGTDAGADLLVRQRSEERRDSYALAAAFDDEEIVGLGRERQERQPVETCDRLDGDAPIGTALRNRGGHGVVRARLVAVTGRPRPAEQLVDEDARAGAGIAIDH